MTGKTSVILDRICWFEEQPADIFICMYISRKSFHIVIAFPTGHSPYKCCMRIWDSGVNRMMLNEKCSFFASKLSSNIALIFLVTSHTNKNGKMLEKNVKFSS